MIEIPPKKKDPKCVAYDKDGKCITKEEWNREVDRRLVFWKITGLLAGATVTAVFVSFVLQYVMNDTIILLAVLSLVIVLLMIAAVRHRIAWGQRIIEGPNGVKNND